MSRVTREQILTASCPACGVSAGECCRHLAGRRVGRLRRLHIERVRIVQAWQAQQQLELQGDQERARG